MERVSYVYLCFCSMPLRLCVLSNGQHVVVAESGHGEMLSRQPEASKKLLSTFFETGTGDDSGFTYQSWEYNPGLGFPAIAKIVTGIIVLLIAVLIFVVRFFLNKRFGM